MTVNATAVATLPSVSTVFMVVMPPYAIGHHGCHVFCARLELLFCMLTVLFSLSVWAQQLCMATWHAPGTLLFWELP